MDAGGRAGDDVETERVLKNTKIQTPNTSVEPAVIQAARKELASQVKNVVAAAQELERNDGKI